MESTPSEQADALAPSAEKDLHRLVTFVDAIVAIAITLLVLPLADLAGEVHGSDSVLHVVQDNVGKFFGFGLSFAVIARLWLAQHQVMRFAREMSRPVLAWIGLWSASIAFLPFPTALLADAGQQATTKVFYIGTLALSAAFLALLADAVRRQQPAPAERPGATPVAIDAVLFALALLVCVLAPSLRYYPLLLLLAAGPVGRAWGRLRRQLGRA